MPERAVPQFLALASSKVLTMLLAFCMMPMVARLLGPDGVGQWMLLLAAGTLLHTALVNWTHSSTLRFGPEEWSRFGSLNRTLGARLPVLAVSVLAAALLLVMQPGDWARRAFSAEPSHWWMIALFALSTWLAAEAQATLQAAGRIVWQAVIAPVLGVLAALAIGALFVFNERSLGAAVLAFTVIPATGWGCAWVYVLARSNTRAGSLSVGDAARHLSYALPMLPTFAVGYLSDWGDHLLLSRLSSVTQVGLFGVSYQFMVAILAGNGVLATVLLPRLVAREVTQPGFTRTYVEAEAPAIFALWMIGTVWIVALLPVAVELLAGSRFEPSVGVLLVLLVSIPASVINSLYGVLFTFQERNGRVFLYVLFMALVNVAASAALIPSFGAVGAAAGTTLSYTLYQALYIWDQHRRMIAPPSSTWLLWGAGLMLGVSQLIVGGEGGARIVWGIFATTVLAGLVRKSRCVNGAVVEQLFAGRLRPVEGLVCRVLVGA